MYSVIIDPFYFQETGNIVFKVCANITPISIILHTCTEMYSVTIDSFYFQYTGNTSNIMETFSVHWD